MIISNVLKEKDSLIGNQIYRILYKVRSSGVAQYYICKDKSTDRYVKLKTEDQGSKNQTVLRQAKIMRYLDSPKAKVPKIYASGTQRGLNYRVFDIHGPDLGKLLSCCGGKLSMGTSLIVGMQLLQLLQYVHSKGMLIRFWNPEIFAYGLGLNSEELMLVQLGRVKHYHDTLTQGHISFIDKINSNENNKFSSCSSELGLECSRRDDLQSFMYMLIYFIKGSLPWQKIQSQTLGNQPNKVLKKKISTSVEQICKKLPLQFVSLLNYAKGLSFKEKPDYNHFRQVFNYLLDMQHSEQHLKDWFMSPKTKKLVHQNYQLNLQSKRNPDMQFGETELSLASRTVSEQQQQQQQSFLNHK